MSSPQSIWINEINSLAETICSCLMENKELRASGEAGLYCAYIRVFKDMNSSELDKSGWIKTYLQEGPLFDSTNMLILHLKRALEMSPYSLSKDSFLCGMLLQKLEYASISGHPLNQCLEKAFPAIQNFQKKFRKSAA